MIFGLIIKSKKGQYSYNLVKLHYLLNFGQIFIILGNLNNFCEIFNNFGEIFNNFGEIFIILVKFLKFWSNFHNFGHIHDFGQISIILVSQILVKFIKLWSTFINFLISLILVKFH